MTVAMATPAAFGLLAESPVGVRVVGNLGIDRSRLPAVALNDPDPDSKWVQLIDTASALNWAITLTTGTDSPVVIGICEESALVLVFAESVLGTVVPRLDALEVLRDLAHENRKIRFTAWGPTGPLMGMSLSDEEADWYCAEAGWRSALTASVGDGPESFFRTLIGLKLTDDNRRDPLTG